MKYFTYFFAVLSAFTLVTGNQQEAIYLILLATFLAKVPK